MRQCTSERKIKMREEGFQGDGKWQLARDEMYGEKEKMKSLIHISSIASSYLFIFYL